MRVGARVDQLRIDPHAIGRTLHAALRVNARRQVAPNLAQVALEAGFFSYL